MHTPSCWQNWRGLHLRNTHMKNIWKCPDVWELAVLVSPIIHALLFLSLYSQSFLCLIPPAIPSSYGWMKPLIQLFSTKEGEWECPMVMVFTIGGLCYNTSDYFMDYYLFFFCNAFLFVYLVVSKCFWS